MDPNFDRSTGFDLPQPVEGALSVPKNDETAARATEANPVIGERTAPPASFIAPPTPSSFPASTPVTPQATPSPVSDDVVSSPIASNGEQISKEWVNKAKQIAEKTRDDPYNQSKGLAKLKAEYMHRYYNKTLKLSE